MWEQQLIKPLPGQKPRPILLWSTRGKLIQIEDLEEARRLINNRWRLPTDTELKRWKKGDYNPIYDLGESASKQVSQVNRVINPSPVGNILKVTVI